ncbi:S-adenosyl-L-methionine-dependent methyltransferase [Chaetomium fimeti]|uniref:S-adenosyl-L-methionine-dependent methyltransferase n=1 Tax=Chaetomium fimeti TaxID=1854472 RepID=A0AAE0LXJ7_9PEZI|nr:S-adenosyl-L-methionine-dependent methyltransferase [Chaetomium fimeti]
MAPPASLNMSFRSADRQLDSYQFTFESYLEDSARIEPDVSYPFPNDNPENDRMEEQYEIIKMVMDGRLHLAPFSRDRPPRHVLDVATGTGIWAVEMGDKYPEAEIVGTDLSPIQPAFVPPNVHFFIEDSSEDWYYPTKFDFIHTRITIGCWSDMKNEIIQRAFDHLEPGGWLECQEIPALIYCDDGTMPDDYGWLRWVRDFQAGGRVSNRQLDLGPQLKEWMHEVGFVDIHEMIFKIPLNGWPKEVRLKHVGMMWQRNLLEGLSGFSLDMFNRLGKSIEEIELSLVEVRNSLFDRSVHAYHKVHVVWGRKPDA